MLHAHSDGGDATFRRACHVADSRSTTRNSGRGPRQPVNTAPSPESRHESELCSGRWVVGQGDRAGVARFGVSTRAQAWAVIGDGEKHACPTVCSDHLHGIRWWQVCRIDQLGTERRSLLGCQFRDPRIPSVAGGAARMFERYQRGIRRSRMKGPNGTMEASNKAQPRWRGQRYNTITNAIMAT